MHIRIVKMTFKPESTHEFEQIFCKHKEQIRGFAGCRYLELLQDRHDRRVYFTYSLWDSSEALESYRRSELFSQVWTATKALFADKPEAWTVDRLYRLE